MPDRRHHRGKHPEDAWLFAPGQLPLLEAAASDYHFLLSRGYPHGPALKITGDHYRLQQRQRLALFRAVCSSDQALSRKGKEISPLEMQGKIVEIDALNQLIVIESALSGGFLFEGTDGCFRDIASIHGTYRKVEETGEAIALCGRALSVLGTAHARWWIDQPVSNSGRLKQMLEKHASDHGWPWSFEVVFSPDAELKKSDNLVITSDGYILDVAKYWFNITRYILNQFLPEVNWIRLTI